MKLLEFGAIKSLVDVYRRTLGSVIVMEWSYVQKSILLHTFTIVLYLSYILYMSVVLQHPEWYRYINVELFHLFIWKDTLIALFAAALGLGCYFWRTRSWAERYLPIISILFYVLAMCSTGYAVGAMSPATGVFLTGTTLVGFALFPRKIILICTILSAVTMTGLAYAGVSGWIPYAPMFPENILDMKIHSTFYFYSQMYFVAPPAIMILLTTDLVLRQWHKRGREVALLSQLDSLTNLYNRRTVNLHLERLMGMSTESDKISILLLDLDYFKHINDHHGHLVGDNVLREVGHLLQSIMRKNDLAGRFGGEEFIVVLYRSAHEIGMSVAERIRLRITEISVPTRSGQTVNVTTSIGVSTFSPFGMSSIDQILSQADQALYKAKDAGRNRVIHYDCLVSTEHASHESTHANATMDSNQNAFDLIPSS
jgi:diguanylate cyclase (GGDEF)-like protein